MQTKQEIKKRLEETKKDNRLTYPTATVDINAPLALEQLRLETEIKILKWVLGLEA